MAGRKQSKDCVDIRICIDEETNKEIIKFQAKRVSKDGLDYKKWMAASDYFMELVQANKQRI